MTEERERAVEIAESVVRWVESHLETGGGAIRFTK